MLKIQHSSSSPKTREAEMPKPLRRLSPRERQVMDALYRLGHATVKEIVEAVDDGATYSAVRAALRVLQEKGQVRHAQDGPRYVYRPVVAPETARRRALSHLVETFFDGSAEEAAVALLKMSDETPTDDARARLVERIERARKEGR